MKNLSTVFQENNPDTPDYLYGRVLSAIERARARQARTWRSIWGAISLLSFAALAESILYSVRSFSTSGFSSYFSIIFSDGKAALSLWRVLGLSLIESLPLLGIGILLASVCAVLWSLRKFARSQNTHSANTAILNPAY